MADAKIAGLKQHYGFTDGDGVAFFDVHRTLDVQHADAERAIVSKALDAGQGEAALDGTRRALGAWWDFLGAFTPAMAA